MDSGRQEALWICVHQTAKRPDGGNWHAERDVVIGDGEEDEKP